MMPRKRDPDIDGGWAWIVLVSVYIGIVITSVCAFGGGAIYVNLLESYNDGKAKTSIIGSLNGGLMCLLGPLASVVMNVTSCRVCLVLGGFLTSLGFLFSFFAWNIDHLILTYGVLGGIGNAFASTSYIVILGYYFEKRRETFIALSVGVIGLGYLIASPLILFILNTYGLHGTFLILSGISAPLCICGFICKPSSTEIELKKKRNNSFNVDNTIETENRISKENLKKKSFQISKSFTSRADILKVLTNLRLILFLFSTLCWNLTLSVVIIHMPNYVSLKNSSDTEISLVMTIFTTSNMMGRFLSAGTVGKDGLDSMLLHVGMLALAGIATITFPYYSNYRGGDYIFAVLIGVYTGGPNSLMTPITLEMVGVRLLSVVHGLEYFFSGVGYLSGPPIAGFLYGKTGSYKYSFIFPGIFLLFGSFTAMCSAMVGRGLTERTKTAENIKNLTMDHTSQELLDFLNHSEDIELSKRSDVLSDPIFFRK